MSQSPLSESARQIPCGKVLSRGELRDRGGWYLGRYNGRYARKLVLGRVIILLREFIPLGEGGERRFTTWFERKKK